MEINKNTIIRPAIRSDMEIQWLSSLLTVFGLFDSPNNCFIVMALINAVYDAFHGVHHGLVIINKPLRDVGEVIGHFLHGALDFTRCSLFDLLKLAVYCVMGALGCITHHTLKGALRVI